MFLEIAFEISSPVPEFKISTLLGFINEYGKAPHIELNEKFYKDINDGEFNKEELSNSYSPISNCKTLTTTNDRLLLANTESEFASEAV